MGVDIKQKANDPFDDNAFEKDVLKEVYSSLKNPTEEIVVERDIINTCRSFGTMISGEIARYYGDEGLTKDTITVKLTGVAGQSLGAFLANGLTIHVNGGRQ